VTGSSPTVVGYLVGPLTGSGRQEDHDGRRVRGFAELTGHELSRILRDELYGRPCAVNAVIPRVRGAQATTVAVVDDLALEAQHCPALETAGVQMPCADPGP
jgi:hypothetical protein